MAKGLNMQAVKTENRSLVLYLLNKEGRLSRKEIAARLSLTPAAVTKICADLIDSGLIAEAGEAQEQARSGRREILLELMLEDKLAFGVYAETDSITLSVSTLSGKLVTVKHIAFYEDVDDVIRLSKQFLTECRIDRSRIVGAGVCIIGSQDEQDFGIWKGENLRQKFETGLGMAVVIENNVKAFAESELLYGDSKKADSVLFMKWGPGIGSAIVAGGKVFSGGDSSVTEIGHYIINPGGKRCRCGRYGCLETEASEAAILSEANTKKSLDELLKNCDNDSMMLIDRKIDSVALALTNTATILDADSVVLFGKMFTNPVIAQKLQRQCLRYNTNFETDTITLSSLNDKSSYIGCSAICAKRFFFERAM